MPEQPLLGVVLVVTCHVVTVPLDAEYYLLGYRVLVERVPAARAVHLDVAGLAPRHTADTPHVMQVVGVVACATATLSHQLRLSTPLTLIIVARARTVIED